MLQYAARDIPGQVNRGDDHSRFSGGWKEFWLHERRDHKVLDLNDSILLSKNFYLQTTKGGSRRNILLLRRREGDSSGGTVRGQVSPGSWVAAGRRAVLLAAVQ